MTRWTKALAAVACILVSLASAFASSCGSSSGKEFANAKFIGVEDQDNSPYVTGCGCMSNTILWLHPERIPKCWLVCTACCNIQCLLTWRCAWCVIVDPLGMPYGLWAGDLYECEDGTFECRNCGFRGCTCSPCAYRMPI